MLLYIKPRKFAFSLISVYELQTTLNPFQHRGVLVVLYYVGKSSQPLFESIYSIQEWVNEV